MSSPLATLRLGLQCPQTVRRVHGCQGRHQRLRPHRTQHPSRRSSAGSGHRDRRCQRHHDSGDAGSSAQVRHHPRSLPRHRVGGWRRPDRRWPRDQGARRARSRQAPVGRPGRRHRRRVDGSVHRRREGQGPHRRRRAQGGHLRARQERGPHRRDGGQREVVRPGQAQHPLQRLVHHQLPCPGGQGAQRLVRHRDGADDHGARVHQRPGGPRRPSQGPSPGTRRLTGDHPHHHRRRQGGGPGPARAQGQVPRHGAARAGARRVAGRPHRQSLQGDHGRGHQRGHARCRRWPAQGHPRGERRAARLRRLPARLALLHLRRAVDHGSGR